MLQDALTVGLAEWLEPYVAENIRARRRSAATLRQPRRVAWLLGRGAWLVFGEGRSASVARTDTVQTRLR